MTKEKHTIEISEHQRQFLSRLVSKYIKDCEKKDFPITPEVETLDGILLLD
jgi:hypothetical protein